MTREQMPNSKNKHFRNYWETERVVSKIVRRRMVGLFSDRVYYRQPATYSGWDNSRLKARGGGKPQLSQVMKHNFGRRPDNTCNPI
ncbi:hypothetical protein E2C01_078746 [Portunus trituberculatus]|uniref:Uncharacterized protein n=1 Tax=Portunus trituberculatus TaxID=210409 RepID=A0A5B7IJM3_PORTR|nr:hypothetical protein [Portunus trituberculatus]